MFKYFFRKIKDFFLSHSKFARFSSYILLLVVLFGLFGLVRPAFANISDNIADNIADILANIFLLIASFLGQLLVVIIGILLEIVSYNNFIDAPAVNTGWTVVRDICNLFFVLILLVIGFGSVLRLENFKYNQLLGKLVIMIVLVNFSKMIAGFFIDVSQVVLITFANAFSATAAANFTDALRLREMLGFAQTEGVGGASTGGLTALEKMGVALLPVILLIVAIFTMIAMVLVFLIRIIMLWILVVLSPMAYLLSVLATTQQYSKQWWSNFIKWVATGPVLAFFIWFGLTLIAGGGTSNIDLQTENAVVGITNQTVANTQNLAASVSKVSSSESLLQFALAIGMFVISLIVAQSLGGMAASFSGKMLGKLQTMGGAAMKYIAAPAYWAARGAGEVAKMGGKKVRRMYRESALGKYTNVGAMFAGAKKRGEFIESRSKERAVAQGKDLWDKRPEWMGGGADVPSESELLERRYERQTAGEVSTLQKEQKAALLQKVWGRGGKEAETTRRALLQSLAAEGHLDDALDTKFFREEAVWHDENGKKQEGFVPRDAEGKPVGEYDSNLTRSNLLRSAISRGSKRSIRAQDTDQAAFGTLQDIQDWGIKNKHTEYAGEIITADKDYKDKGIMKGDLTYAEETTDDKGQVRDRMDYKNEIQIAEGKKPTDRVRVGEHPQNFSVQARAQDGKNLRLIPFPPLDDNASEEEKRIHKENKAQWESWVHKSNYAKSASKSFREFSSARIDQLLGEMNPETSEIDINNDSRAVEQIRRLYQEFPEIVGQIEKKFKVSGYTHDGKSYASLHDFAAKMESAGEKGWSQNSDYHKEETEAVDARKEVESRQQSTIDHELNSADEKEDEARQLRQQAGQTSSEINNLETDYNQHKAEADRLNQEAEQTRRQFSSMPSAGFEVGTPENVAKKQKLQSELKEKEIKAAAARTKADSTKSKLDSAYAKQTSSDPEKIRQAEKKESEATAHRAKAAQMAAEKTSENFDQETNDPIVIKDMESNIKSDDIKQISGAIESAMGNVIKSTKGVDINIFSAQYSGITTSINNLLVGLQKMNTTLKNELSTHFGNTLQGINAGQYSSRQQQIKTLEILNKFNKTLSKRAAGKANEKKDIKD